MGERAGGAGRGAGGRGIRDPGSASMRLIAASAQAVVRKCPGDAALPFSYRNANPTRNSLPYFAVLPQVADSSAQRDLQVDAPARCVHRVPGKAGQLSVSTQAWLSPEHAPKGLVNYSPARLIAPTCPRHATDALSPLSS